MAIRISSGDERLTWKGAISLERSGGWVRAWRIPFAQRKLFHSDGLLDRASMAAGVRICFASDTTTLAGRIETGEPEMTAIDLVCDGQVTGSIPLAGKDSFEFDNLASGMKKIELWLPQFGQFRLGELQLSEGAKLEKWADEGRRHWITYGSSITQCRSASSPTQTWPAIVARQRGWDLTCLGYGGNCHIEPMMARMIRDLPADYLSLCLGINVHGNGSLNIRTFRPAVLGFVQILRERHAGVPLILISPIYSPSRETTPSSAGLTLQVMREEIQAAVATLRELGDQHVHYVNGLEILGPESVAHLPDGLHPDPEGYRLMGKRFMEKVADVWFAQM